MLVRVVDYSIDDGRDNAGTYRLFTTLIDPAETPAVALASAYTRRWEIELVLDELRTHQRGPRTVLRSKSPDLVRQEIWGHLCCHYAIWTLMADAAGHTGRDPDRVSFVAALRIARQAVAPRGAFPPDDHQATSRVWLTALRRVADRLNPARRCCAAARVIKRNMPKWHVKRAHHAAWPRPQHPPDYRIVRSN
jgi:hypothetical protein